MLEYKMCNFECICRPNVKSKFQLGRDEIVLTKSRLSIASRERRVVSRYRRSAPRRAAPCRTAYVQAGQMQRVCNYLQH